MFRSVIPLRSQLGLASLSSSFLLGLGVPRLGVPRRNITIKNICLFLPDMNPERRRKLSTELYKNYLSPKSRFTLDEFLDDYIKRRNSHLHKFDTEPRDHDNHDFSVNDYHIRYSDKLIECLKYEISLDGIGNRLSRDLPILYDTTDVPEYIGGIKYKEG